MKLPNSFYELFSMTCQKRKVINVDKYHKSIVQHKLELCQRLLLFHSTTPTPPLYTLIEKENRIEVKVRENHQQKNGEFFPLWAQALSSSKWETLSSRSNMCVHEYFSEFVFAMSRTFQPCDMPCRVKTLYDIGIKANTPKQTQMKWERTIERVRERENHLNHWLEKKWARSK